MIASHNSLEPKNIISVFITLYIGLLLSYTVIYNLIESKKN